MSKLNNTGRYEAKVKSAEFGEANTGTPFFNIYFETPEGSIGRSFFLTTAALPHTVKMLREAFSFNNDFETAVEQVIGKACTIVVGMKDDGRGGERLEVEFVNKEGFAKPIADKSKFLKGISAVAKMMPKEAPKTGGAKSASLKSLNAMVDQLNDPAPF